MTDSSAATASERDTPRGRQFQLRIMTASGVTALFALILICAYLSVLLRFTPDQWSLFGAIVAGLFVVLFVLQAWTHQRLWAPLVDCLDARADGHATEHDLVEGFRAITGLPPKMVLWGEFWWLVGGMLVAGAMAWLDDGFRFFSAVVMVVAAGSGGFVTGLVHYFVMKRGLASMRLQLAEELGDPEIRASHVQRVSLRRKLVLTMAGTTCVVVLFASLLSSVHASRAVEGSAVAQQARLLDRIVRDYDARGDVAISEGSALAADLGIADAIDILLPDAASGSTNGIDASEFVAIRAIGLESGDSLGFDSPSILTWRALADGRVLVLRTNWRVAEGMVQQAGWIFCVFFLLAVGVAVATARLLAEDVALATSALGVEVERMARGDLRPGRV